MIQLIEPYRRRPIRFLELWEPEGWRIKVYGIAYNRELPRPELVATAKRLAANHLANDRNHYGVGFLGIHDGRGANFVFFDFWADENELHHHVYTSPSEETENLRLTGPDDSSVCVWDLQVQAFERQAWIEGVLANPFGPNLDQYVECRIDADV
jgi:hypothetical protein